MTYKIHDSHLYSYESGVSVGVLITEKVMKKLAKMQAKHLEDVKRLLTDSEGDVFPSMWTLYYPDGEQTVVKYIDTMGDLKRSIRCAVSAHSPVHHPVCFVASSMDEAKEMAEARFSEVGK